MPVFHSIFPLWEQVGPLDINLLYAMDFDLWIRLALGGSQVVLPDVLHYYRRHESGLSKRSDIYLAPFRITVLKKQLQEHLSPEQSQRVKSRIAENYRCIGWAFHSDRQYAKAIDSYFRALCTYASWSAIKGVLVSSVHFLFRRS